MVVPQTQYSRLFHGFFAVVAGVEVVINLLGELGADAVHLGELFGGGFADVVDRAEVGEELFLAVVAESGDFAEARASHAIAALLAMEADGEAVGFVAQAAE